MKKNYYLKSKHSDEVISKIEAESEELAIEYFSKLKKLKSSDLLEIYIVDDKAALKN